MQPSAFGAKAGTLGGTLTILVVNVSTQEMLKTAILAAIGATISFCISYLLKLAVQRKKQ